MPCRSTPRALVSRRPALCFPAHRKGLSRPEPAARNSLSLARNDCRFRDLHSGVNAPDLLLRSHVHRTTARSTENSIPQPVCFRLRRFHHFRPVAAISENANRCAPVSAPLRDFLGPSSSTRSTGMPRFGPPSVRPDFRLLPAGFVTSNGGSSFPVRYVAEACCSSNLLEPPLICACRLGTSTGLCFWRYGFDQCFSMERVRAVGGGTRVFAGFAAKLRERRRSACRRPAAS
jgi:hypothetical protein